MARKYQSYSIQVKYLNGDKENIEILSEMNIEKTSYKETLKFYNEVKESYADKNVDLEFCGVNSENCVEILFTKEYRKPEDIDIKEIVTENPEQSEKHEDKTTEELIDSLSDIMINLKERNNYISTYMGLLDKKTDVYLHQLENKAVLGLTDSDLLKICDGISDARNQRRDLKSEISLMAILNNKNIIGNIEDIVNLTDKKSKKIECIHKTVTETLSCGKEIKSLKIDEFTYKNFEERMRIMKRMESTHDRITYDNGKMLIYGYKKCK